MSGSGAVTQAPRVAVVIPVYNRCQYLGETVVSVLAQTLPDLALMVVDDGSQEDVAGYLAEYADPRLTVLRQANQGNAAARNAGIRATTSEFVLCLDSDDVLEPTMLEACVAHLRAHPEIDVVYTQHRYIDGEGAVLPKPPGPEPREGDLLEPLIMGFPILPSSAVVLRACFERWGDYSPGLDDWELWLRWSAQGCRFACLPQPLLRYRLHAQNLNADLDRRRDAHFRMLDVFYARSDLPARALALRDRAYAQQHLRFAVVAMQSGRGDQAGNDYARAVALDPALLEDLDAHMQIACAHQGRLRAGTAEGLDLAQAEQALLGCVGAATVGAREGIVLNGRRARASAYIALGRLAYGVAHDMRAARRYLAAAARTWPGVMASRRWAPWAARSGLGFGAIQRARRALAMRR